MDSGVAGWAGGILICPPVDQQRTLQNHWVVPVEFSGSVLALRGVSIGVSYWVVVVPCPA